MKNLHKITGFYDIDTMANKALDFVHINFKKIFDEQNKGNKVNIAFNFKRKRFNWYIADEYDTIKPHEYNSDNLIVLEFYPMDTPNEILDDESDWYSEYLNKYNKGLLNDYKSYDGDTKHFHEEFVGKPDWYEICFQMSLVYWNDYYSDQDYSNIIDILRSIEGFY